MNVSHRPKGTAIYIPVCPTKSCCRGGKIHHLTLAHVETTDPQLVSSVMLRVRKCIKTNHFLTDTPYGKVVSYELGKEGPRSTLLEGDVESFKQSLDAYLRLDLVIAGILSPYRAAHVDRFNQEVHYYKVFRVEDLRIMEDH